jgi:hypothetical protein
MYCSCYSNTGCYSHGQRRLNSTIAGMTQRLGATSPTSHPTQRFTTDQTQGLQDCHSNWRSNSGTFLPTSSASTWGEHVIATMLWDTSSNQLSHFLSCILFWVNILIYFQLVNSSILAHGGQPIGPKLTQVGATILEVMAYHIPLPGLPN